MKNITFETTLFDTEGTWETYTNDIFADGVKIGRADTMIDTENEDEVYLEWIAIDEEFQNQGFGTKVIQMLAEEHGYIYFAPCDEDNVRLYERIAEESDDHSEIDQGFGVYCMEG